MRTLHLIGEDGTYTNLAFLLSEQCTHMVKLAVFEWSKKSVLRDRRELSGSLPEQLEEDFDYIDRYNRTRAEFSGLDRSDMRDYPPEAVREALLNAIVHRDYSFSAATLVSIFEDRIEFVTIGGLVKGGPTSMTRKEERINAVLELYQSKGSVVRSDAETALGVSQSTAILLLRELTDEGILIKKGKTKKLRYYENKRNNSQRVKKSGKQRFV